MVRKQQPSRKHILFLTPQFPYPPNQGTTIRNFNLIKRVARDYHVDLCTFANAEEAATLATTPIATACRHVHTVPLPQPRPLKIRLWTTLSSPWPDMALRLASPAMHDCLHHLMTENRYDIVQIEGIEMAHYAFDLPRGNAIWVFDDHNAEYLLQKRAFLTDIRRPERLPAAIYSLIQWRKLRRYEQQVCKRHDRVIAVSEADKAALQHISPNKPICVIPNGVDIAYYGQYRLESALKAPHLPTLSLVFTGKMDYRPNVDGVLWFVKRVWPAIRAKHPRAQFYIVGQKPHRRLSELSNVSGVFVTGKVLDVRPYIAGATVYVVPLRIGGGTRLKVMEAMAMRKAIIATPLGAEGFPVAENQQLRLASSPRAFANAVIDLIERPEERQRLGENGYRFVVEQYDWNQIVRRLLSIYEET